MMYQRYHQREIQEFKINYIMKMSKGFSENAKALFLCKNIKRVL